MEKFDTQPGAPEQDWTQVTMEDLIENPVKYREQLGLLVESLPWDESVKNVGGHQANSIVEFCLDSKNINLISSSVERIYGEEEPLSEYTQQLLRYIDEQTPEKSGVPANQLRTEKILRRRLLAWMDYLDESGVDKFESIPDASGQ